MGKMGRVLIAAVTGGCLVLGVAGAVPLASATGLAVCQGNGSLVVTGSNAGGFTWQLQGGGSCADAQFPPSPTVVVEFSGGGTSSTLGLCSGSLDVTNLQLHVSATYTDFTNNTTSTQQQTWFAAASTFPLDTPFLVTTSTGAIGAGVMFSHIFLQCGNDGGKPSANFNWTQTT